MRSSRVELSVRFLPTKGMNKERRLKQLCALAFAALSFAAPTGQALAENWVGVAVNDDGASLSVDKDSIRRGGDGLVYFRDDSGDQSDNMAADCAKRVSYTISMDLIIGKHLDDPNWRDKGKPVQPGSFGEAELKYVCANAG